MENEMKLFILMRSDMEIKASELIVSLGNSFNEHMRLASCREEWNERNNFYFHIQPAYPKICKRFKRKDADRVARELENLGLPYVPVVVDNVEGSEIAGYIFGPAYRSELPKALDKLQLMQDSMVIIDESKSKGDVEIGYRNDIEIPAGKLIPQFCHAIQKYWCENNISSSKAFSLKGKNLSQIKRESNYITDAGRTYFNEPTITTNFLEIHGD